jgi:hypothetical protein
MFALSWHFGTFFISALYTLGICFSWNEWDGWMDGWMDRLERLGFFFFSLLPRLVFGQLTGKRMQQFEQAPCKAYFG